jgi:hypothetical protein
MLRNIRHQKVFDKDYFRDYSRGSNTTREYSSMKAFPTHREEGMDLRDYFAATALQGMLAEDGGGAASNKDLAEFAYVIADAMMEARK